MSSETRGVKSYIPSAPRIRVWLHALRAPFLTASAIPVLIGASAAFWKTGSFAVGRFLVTLGGVVSLHLGANLANDYFDYVTGCDDLNPEPTPFSGGSRVIQHGLISSRAILIASCFFFALGMGQGLWLNSTVAGNRVLWLGLAGLAGGVLYSAVPFKLSYRGIGELVVFAMFGPLAVAGSYLCQTESLEVYPFLVALPAGLLVLAILLVNEVLDVEWDEKARKRTLVVMLGKRRGYLLYLAAYLAAYAWIVVGLFLRIYPPLAILALVPLVVSMRRLSPANALHDRPSTVNASRLTVLSHALAGAIIAVAYFASRVW
jgi:1,4-dihydroxy-2-naphthoate octaprenyltransferase